MIKPNYFFYTWTALVKDLRQNQSNEERVIALADRITNLTNRMHQLSFDRTENNAALIQTHSCAVTMWNIAVAMKTGGQQSGTAYNAKCKSLCSMMSSIIAIVNKGEWLWRPANIKGAHKHAKIYVGMSMTVHNPLFCAHTLCMTGVTWPTRFYWLVPQYGVNHYCVLCMVKAKKANKNLQQRTLSSFITIPLLITTIIPDCLKITYRYFK